MLLSLFKDGPIKKTEGLPRKLRSAKRSTLFMASMQIHQEIRAERIEMIVWWVAAESGSTLTALAEMPNQSHSLGDQPDHHPALAQDWRTERRR